MTTAEWVGISLGETATPSCSFQRLPPSSCQTLLFRKLWKISTTVLKGQCLPASASLALLTAVPSHSFLHPAELIFQQACSVQSDDSFLIPPIVRFLLCSSKSESCFFTHVCVCAYIIYFYSCALHTYLCEGVRSPETVVTGNDKLLDSSPLEGQPVLLTAEPSLQLCFFTLTFYFLWTYSADSQSFSDSQLRQH